MTIVEIDGKTYMEVDEIDEDDCTVCELPRGIIRCPHGRPEICIENKCILKLVKPEKP